jgi:SAM-dependent methyltransferase
LKGKMSDLDLERTYLLRFEGEEEQRRQVWSVLTSRFFSKWIRPTDTVLDLGAGHCEFLNSVRAGARYALDMNPSTRTLAAPGVNVLEQDAAAAWDLPSDSVDVIFSSNFLEHMPSKNAVASALAEARRVLRPGGRFLAMGPNIRFCYDVYWDYFDHYVPLSDRSLAEALLVAGLDLEEVVPRFLPCTMKGKLAQSGAYS